MGRSLLGSWTLLLGSCASLIVGSSAQADVKLPRVFSSNMVLQREMKVPVWGTADDGEEVTVTFQGQTLTTKAEGGKWRVNLEPLKASKDPATLTVSGKNKVEFQNVLVGEVWVCSGQSNMEWSLLNTDNSEEVISASTNPMIRLFVVQHQISETPAEDVKAQWQWVQAMPDSVRYFTAVGYFFGREIELTQDVPVGLIQSAWGGTPAEAWTPEASLEEIPEWANKIKNFYGPIAAKRDEIAAKYKQQVSDWQEASKKAKAEGKQAPNYPNAPMAPGLSPHWPSGLYNGMIYPIQPFAIRGVIWYQGESNAGDPIWYETLFPAMITSWRKTWGEGDFPFYFVQLAPFWAGNNEGTNYAGLRDSQRRTLELPNTAMAVITDTVTDVKDIHPRRKKDVGERLALAARQNVHGEKIAGTSPMFSGLTIDGNKAIVSFDTVGGGLEAKDGELKGFTIAGADKVFHPATAVIEGDKVVVSSPAVAQPEAVRFGYKNVPEVNLFTKEGLPVSPFRSEKDYRRDGK